MKVGRILVLVLGCILALPALGMVLSGLILGGASAAAEMGDGYFDVNVDRMSSPTAAITAEEIDMRTQPGTPRWVLDATDTDVRLRASAVASDESVFIGIARERDLDRYLAGVAHDEIVDVNDDLAAEFRPRVGGSEAGPPADEDFWVVSSAGVGTQEIEWQAQAGRWAVAVMNADGSAGVDVDVNVGARSAALGMATAVLLGFGSLLGLLAMTLIVVGGIGLSGSATPPRPVGPGQPPASGPPAPPSPSADPPLYPVSLSADLDPGLSRWMWLIKWILAIPHVIVLFFLWIAFVVLTIVAGVSILFTGRYPRSLFDFNVGFLRWGWRVSYFAFSGGVGTDQYPPFSLHDDPSYPARFNVAYPEKLSRGLVLIKWWLLAIPHYVVVAVLIGGGVDWSDETGRSTGNAGLLSLLVLVAAVILLVTGRYPQALFNLIVGLNRWVYRVFAYAALMTDRYPPFRLDQGGADPSGDPILPTPYDDGPPIALDKTEAEDLEAVDRMAPA